MQTKTDIKRFEDLSSILSGKRVLFITTKNTDYIRVTQEMELLESLADKVTVIGSPSMSYPKRLLAVYRRLLTQSLSDIDVVFVGFSPQLIMPLFLKKLKKRPVIIDFFISMYDTMVWDRKKFGPGGAVAKFLHRIDERTIKKADYVVCDTKAHGGYFAEEFGVPQDVMHVLYLHANTDIYYPREKSIKSAVHRVLYFGSILNLQGVDVILEAAESFANDEDFEFEIIGPIPESMHPPQANNIHYIDWLSQQELADHIAEADLCLAGHFSKDIMKARRTIPGKAYIYEAMGKPMILGDGPANHELFTEDATHLYVPLGDPVALASRIRSYFS